MTFRVGHFIDSFDSGGAESLVIQICNETSRLGFEPEIYHFGNEWLEEQCFKFSINSKIVPGYKYYRSIFTIPIFSIIFRNFLRQRKISLLHSHLFGSITSASFSAYSIKLPHLGTIHDSYTIAEKTTRVRLFQVAALLKTLLITVSNEMEAYLTLLGKFPEKSIQTIYNGVDLKRFEDIPVGNLRNELEILPDEIVLIYVGRLVKIKGLIDLIEAISLLSNNEKLKTILVGDGPEKKEIETKIAQNNLKNKVKLLGYRDDVLNLLKISNCFVMSSYSEGLSISLLESMAAGLPSVVTNVGGNKELVYNSKTGFLVPSGSPVALAKKLQVLIDNPSMREEFGAQAFIKAKENFSVEKMIQKYIDAYKKILVL